MQKRTRPTDSFFILILSNKSFELQVHGDEASVFDHEKMFALFSGFHCWKLHSWSFKFYAGDHEFVSSSDWN